MEDLKFRTLYANEVECRVASIKEKGLSLLIYKDSRVDQNLLDEVVGPMNWQRKHSRDNRNCTVSIWDQTKNQWVEKEDTGTESNTESEKGLASDSFKRACFNWGIGRELYTAPFIWVDAKDCNISKGSRGNLVCYDKFDVAEIGYEDKTITRLVIRNTRNNKIVYSYGESAPKTGRSVSNRIAPEEISLEEEIKMTEEMFKNAGADFDMFLAKCNTNRESLTKDSINQIKNWIMSRQGSAQKKKNESDVAASLFGETT